MSSNPAYSHEWTQASLEFRRQHSKCLGCGNPATIVDHVVPHRGDQKVFWDKRNWQPSCEQCHKRVKSILEKRWSNAELHINDLWLSSPQAQRLIKVRIPRGIGADGWLLD
jgi:5-methylcytosine-specific restriction endonuclease McrA